ncbi:MAG: T9SS type A sorting domain-containing protein [Candidatus Saganbacteria bacterium]|nr:T9SS type A sorting domain-containing protein [Candidatus Saganbacteria bacterium]
MTNDKLKMLPSDRAQGLSLRAEGKVLSQDEASGRGRTEDKDNAQHKVTNYGWIIIIGIVATLGIGTRAEAITAFATMETPEIMRININGTRIFSGDPITSLPQIAVTAATTSTMETMRLKLGTINTNITFTQSGNTCLATYNVTSAIAAGTYGLTIEAFTTSGKAATYEVYPLYIRTSNDLTIQGYPLNYPNPFDPGSQTTTISYTLSKSSNVKINIFDLAGNLLVSNGYSTNQPGGTAGYNEVTWDGKASGGSYVGNGIYIYLIIADGKVAQNGTGKIVVFKQ